MYRGQGDPSCPLGPQKAAGDWKAAWPSGSPGHPELAPEGEPGGGDTSQGVREVSGWSELAAFTGGNPSAGSISLVPVSSFGSQHTGLQ